MRCPVCQGDMLHVDTTYSNVDTERVRKGEHTGDVYECEECEELFLDDVVRGELREWSY